MRKIVICLIAVTFFLKHSSLAAGKTLKTAILLWIGETKAKQGFKDGLKELGYSTDYTIMNLAQKREALRRILSNEISPKLNDLDYICTFGTTASKMTQIFIHDKVPHIFNIVFAPVEAGRVRSMEKTGGNIGGATHWVTVSVRIVAAFKKCNHGR